jgi:Flp pilus assembly protein TadG
MQIAMLRSRRKEQGSAAVECVLVLPIFLLLSFSIFLFSRIFWHYTVAEKAAHDATMFLARASLKEIRAPSSGVEIPIAQVARSIAASEVAELSPGDSPPFVDVLCNGLGCAGFTTPQSVAVVVRMQMTISIFPDLLATFDLPSEINLTAQAETNYVGDI